MQTYRVAVIPGDGIGHEVVPAAIRVLEAAAERSGFGLEWEHFPWGSEHYFAHGRMMPADALDRLRPFDAIFFGAVGDPRLQDNVTLNGLLLPIRRGFDQYACVRPAVLYPGVRCPLAGKQPGEIDFVVVRENTEGEYAQVGGVLYPAGPHEVAVQSADLHAARHRARDSLRVRSRAAAEPQAPPDVGHQVERAGLQHGVLGRASSPTSRATIRTSAPSRCSSTRPAWIWSGGRRRFDVMVASNLFGDILTDLSAAITGSLGLAPSANLNPAKTFPSMFEPVHGSAPDIAGRGIANPMAAMLSGALMLDFLGEAAAAALVEQAVLGVLTDRREITPDLGGTGTTRSVSDAVVARVRKSG